MHTYNKKGSVATLFYFERCIAVYNYKYTTYKHLYLLIIIKFTVNNYTKNTCIIINFIV